MFRIAHLLNKLNCKMSSNCHKKLYFYQYWTCGLISFKSNVFAHNHLFFYFLAHNYIHLIKSKTHKAKNNVIIKYVVGEVHADKNYYTFRIIIVKAYFEHII